MKKKVFIRAIEFYDSFENPVQFSIYVNENKELEQIRIFFNSWENVKRFCNKNFSKLLFVRAIIFNKEGLEEFVLEELRQ